MRTEKDFLEHLNRMKQMAREEGYDSLDETFVEHEKCRFFGQDVVIGRSERILLREIKEGDLGAFCAFYGAKEEPVLKAFFKETPEESREHLQAYISSMYPLYDYGIWSVTEISTGEVLGLCGFGRRVISGEEVTDLGYYIRPEARRQGLASEAVNLALEYGKHYLELPEVYAFVKKENHASIGLLQKFDFCPVKECETEEAVVYRKRFMETGDKFRINQI